MIERWDLLCAVFSQNLRRIDFQDFFCCSWIVYSWQQSAATDGRCEHHHLTRPFSQCEPLQGILVQVKSEKVWCIDNKWIGISAHRTTSPTMCEVTWNTWESVSVVLMPISMKASCIEALLSLVWFFCCQRPVTVFLVQMTSHCIGSSLSPHSSMHGHLVVVCFSDCLDISIHFVFLISVSLITLFFLLPSTSSSPMWWTNPLCNSAEDLGTLAENEPLTGWKPNDHHIMEATEPYIQESSVENGSPNDFEHDDVTIGKALSSPLFTQEREDDASRGRAYHSQEEGLSSCLSSSVSHDRTGRPVVCSFDSQVSSVQETRHNSESEQIRILLGGQREQILADCQAEFRKHEFQADYDRRRIQKLNEMIESQQEEISRAHQGDERLRRDQQLLLEQLLAQNRDLREAHETSLSEMEELKRFQGSTFDTVVRKIGRRSRYYPWTHWQDTGITEWNWLHERFKRFSRCWISMQWTFPRCQPTCVFPTSSSSWWNAEPFSGNATCFFRKLFCKSSSVFFSTLSAGVESMEF